MKKYGRIGIKKGLKILIPVLFVCLAALTFTSCGGGDGGGSGNPAGAPPVLYISASSPSSYTTNVPVNTTVTATFNVAIDASTITTETFNVAGIAGSVTYNKTNRTATFTPTSSLSYNTTYTATVNNGIKGEAGDTMRENATWTFTTTRWRTPTIINTSAGATNASAPQIAFGSNGNALAVWSQHGGQYVDGIYANYYTPGIGWGTANLITGGNSYTPPQIDIDKNGNAIAVWSQYDGTYPRIFANYYTAGGGWGTSKIIDKNVIYASSSSPKISFDSNGNAIAVWYQWDGFGYNIYANYYTAVTGWGTASLIETNTAYAYNPQITMDSNGNAIAVWHTFYDIYTNYYTAGVGWGTASLIENSTGDTGSPQIAFDSNGNAIAVWIQNDGTYDSIYANYYTAGAGWGTANLIETYTGHAKSPQIAFDANGNAIAVWYLQNGPIYANHYTAGAGWGETQGIIATHGYYIESAKVAFDTNRNVIIVWEQYDGISHSIYASYYTAATGWRMAYPIENNTGYAESPQIAFDANDNAIAVWMQYDSTRKYSDIYASEFR